MRCCARPVGMRLFLGQHAADAGAGDVLAVREHRLLVDIRHCGEHARLPQRRRAVCRQSASVPSRPESVACAVTLRMRVRSSRSKPFMTDSTTISIATPSVSPEHRDQRDEGHKAAPMRRAQVARADQPFVCAGHAPIRSAALRRAPCARRAAPDKASQIRSGRAPRRRSTRRSTNSGPRGCWSCNRHPRP